jgi:transposase
VLGDRGYDAEVIRQGLRLRGIRPWLAKRNTNHGSGLGRYRWVVERTFAWLNRFIAVSLESSNVLLFIAGHINCAC